MSFTKDVKQELAGCICGQCCEAVELAAFSVLARPGKALPAEAQARLSALLARSESAAGLAPDGLDAGHPGLASKLRKTCCARAFLRVAFLCFGSASMGDGGYELRFDLPESAVHTLLQVMKRFELQPHVAAGKEADSPVAAAKKAGPHVAPAGRAGPHTASAKKADARAPLAPAGSPQKIYLKQAEAIAQMLSLCGANRSRMQLEDVQAGRHIRNKIQQKVNCDTANIGKMTAAATRQREAIQQLEAAGVRLPLTLLTVCEARMEDRVETLEELAARLGISKSALNHRLRRIEQLAQDVLIPAPGH